MIKNNIIGKNLRKFIYIIIVLCVLLPIGNLIVFKYNLPSNSGNDKDLPFLKTSESVSPIFINGSGTGVGAHNWSWVELQTWFDGGNGSWNNPYLIEDITISASYASTCFEIVDSNKYFILKDSLIYYSGASPYAGIKMENVNNSKIINCNIRWNQGDGITLNSCMNINISLNLIFGNEGNGASFNKVHNVTLEYNIIENNLVDGVYFENADNITLLENLITSNIWRGGNFNSVNDIYIMYNEIVGNNREGLLLQFINNSFIIDNAIGYNSITGLDFTGVNNKIINNSINSNLGGGVNCHWYGSLDSCYNNTFGNNEIMYNYGTGLELQLSNNNNITKNYINYNRMVGLLLSYADNNNVTGNSINYNEGNWGVYLDYSDNNSIIENQIMGNKGTITQSHCSGNIIVDNIYEILKNIFIDISKQIFHSEYFNITFFIFDESNSGITVDSIQVWWNGTEVSSAIENLGVGLHLISLDPITVAPGEQPILLNMTVNANGYEEKYFEINLAVDPETIEKDTPQDQTPPAGILGYNLIIIIVVLSFAALAIIIKKNK